MKIERIIELLEGNRINLEIVFNSLRDKGHRFQILNDIGGKWGVHLDKFTVTYTDFGETTFTINTTNVKWNKNLRTALVDALKEII